MALWTPAEITTRFWAEARNASPFADLSGNENPLTAVSGYSLPSVVSDEINSHAVWRFNGTSQLVESACGLNIRDAHVFVVAKSSSDFISLHRSSGSSADRFYVRRAFFNWGSNSVSFTGSNNWRIFESVAVGDNKEGLTTANTQGTTTDTNIGTFTHFRLGGGQTGNNIELGACDVAAIVKIDPASSQADIERVQGYLAWEFGLEGDLPSGHPYKAAAPTLLTVSGNARFSQTIPAALVIARQTDHTEIARAMPSADPIGDYELATSATGPMLVTAHAFDPENWRGIWIADTVYAAGDVVFSNGATDSDSLVLECTAVTGAATSASTEPTWDATVGNNTTDNELTWTTLGTIRDLAPITNYYVT